MNRKTSSILFLIIIFLIMSIFIIRMNMLINRGYVLSPDIFEDTLSSLLYKPFVLPKLKDFTYLLILSSFIGLYYIYNKKNKNFMKEDEHGSAKFGSKKDIKNIQDKNKFNNLILSKNISYSIDPKTSKRNNNILVIGGAGTGKSRFVVKPNLCQLHSNYVITDPKGEILRDTGEMFKEEGYNIKVLDLYELEKSFKYNPLNYIKNETDILITIKNLMDNTDGGEMKQKTGDPFWDRAETALYQSLIAFIWLYLAEEEKNISTILELIELIKIDPKDKSIKCEMDIIMEHYNRLYPGNFAYKQWLIFRTAESKTATSILMTVGTRLASFNIQAIKELTSSDEMEIEKTAYEKTVYFLLIPDSHKTFNFISSIFLQQLFSTLYYEADFKLNGSLKIPLRCMLDEFANIGKIPYFEDLISTMRSRGISSTIIIQNLAQLKARYKDTWGTIVGNCDSFLYLGSIEKETNKYISESLGKKTVELKTRGESKGRNKSYNINYQKIGRDLLTADEVRNIDRNKCISIITGLNPFLDNKFDLKNHKNYSKLYDGEKSKTLPYDYYKNKIKQNITIKKKETEEERYIRLFKDIIDKNSDIEEPIIKEELLNVFNKKIKLVNISEHSQLIKETDFDLEELKLQLKEELKLEIEEEYKNELLKKQDKLIKENGIEKMAINI